MIDKREFERRVVPDLLDMFDQIVELERACDEYRRAFNGGTVHTQTDAEMLRLGKSITFRESVWGDLPALQGETFEQWVERYVIRVPNWMSRQTFYSYFASDLKRAWEAALKEADDE